MLFHAGFQTFGGGFVGVDVFFVISGYLITSIILHEKSQSQFSLLGFFERRIRRIFPALFLMLALCVPLAWLILVPSDLKEFSESLVASALFFANIHFWLRSDYFAVAAELQPLLHTWSLAVEEQFYLLFPALLLLTWGLGRRWQMAGILAIAATSLIAAQWLIGGEHAAAAFFLLPTRMWQLMIGALAACWLIDADHRAKPQPYRQWFSLAGLLMILTAVLVFDRNTTFAGLPALLPTIGAALIILYSTGRDWVGRILSHRLMVSVGLISYGLYLWHFPLISFARHLGIDDPFWLGGIGLLAFGFAWLSWKYVEVPVRTRYRANSEKVYAFASLGVAGLCALGLTGIITDGFATSYVNRTLKGTQANYALLHRHAETERAPLRLDDGQCTFRMRALDAEFERRFGECARRLGKGIVLIGDSHASNIHNALYRNSYSKFFVSLARGGCRPYPLRAECPSYPLFLNFAARHRDSIEAIVFHMSGSHLLRDQRGKADSDAAFVEGSPYMIAYDHIQQTSDYLNALSANARVVWLGPFAEARVNLRDPRNYSRERLQFNRVSLALFDHLEQELKRIAGNGQKFAYVPLVEKLKFDGNSLVIGDCLTFRNVDHFSACGEALFGNRIIEALRLAGINGE